MSNEIDLDQFIQVLDHALAPDDPKVKKALKKFLFIAALALDGDPEPGPFTAMFDEMDELRRRMRSLEEMLAQKVTQTDYTEWYGTSSSPTWINVGTGTSTSGNVSINPSSTSGGTTNITGGSSCGGFVNPTTTTVGTYGTLGGYSGFTINLGDDEKGKRIKEELKEKLGTLSK
jgi:hypothetical protein